MKEENGRAHSGIRRRKHYFYVVLGGVALVLAAAIIIVSLVIANRSSIQAEKPNTSVVIEDPSKTGDDSGNTPVVVKPDEFCNPVSAISVINDYGFYLNKSLNKYYEHKGVDFSANEGDPVYTVLDGTVEEIYTSDVLVCSQIVINHGNGVKTIYEFVEPKSGLKVGDKVSRGEEIAKVAAASGNEYKDGSHLHFEVMEDNIVVDPTKYLTFEEK